ncbi:MAG TPA: family 16 glycosylhydrolase [Bryobacteraceae bacterium]|nr:family 16 glycosylhydrolase [Bryobacteraceae bacterium]
MRTVIAILFAALLAASCASAQTAWKLVWSDEFNGAAGTPPDPTKWTYDLGNNGWGNNELETYTNAAENAHMDGLGNLDIHVENPASGTYTSARIKTEGLFAAQYGLFEARIKLPIGQGIWPAFWVLGTDITTVGWPQCGEIDIMENIGSTPTVNYGSVHAPSYDATATDPLPFGRVYADDFHVFDIEWSAQAVTFYVDGTPYETVTSAGAGSAWVFNTPFFIILNVAVGGNWPGSPDSTTRFPQDMLVDYVRVYQAASATATTPVITPGSVANAASFLGTVAPGGLAVIYGNNLAGGTYSGTQVTDNAGNFLTTVGDVSVTVGGTPAALTYVSATQINFQIPWEVTPGTAVNVQVTRAGTPSQNETITIAADTAPSMFLEDYTTGIAWMTGPGCETSECGAQTGGVYQLWANALGPKNAAEQDGVPAVYAGSLTPLEVPGGNASCQLTIGGKAAAVDYCGAAPGEIIDQVNFTYPSGVSSSAPYVDTTLTINGVTGRFRLPAPAQ